MRYLIFMGCCGVVFFLVSSSIAGDFPYREKFPEVNVIELVDLKSCYDRGDFIIVDVRSIIEFETIHIKSSLNIPYGNANFTRDFNRIARIDLSRKIVLYDNGINSLKSYKGAEESFLFASIPNIYAFDAGITAWAKAYPSATLLFGDELKTSMARFISEEEFIDKTLDINTVRKKAVSSKGVVIDVRDPIQRKEKLPGFEKALPVPVDKFVRNIISKGHMKDKKLFIFDQVGGQIKWVMYYLVDEGYTDFYFLNGGATSVLKEQEYRVAFAQ